MFQTTNQEINVHEVNVHRPNHHRQEPRFLSFSYEVVPHIAVVPYRDVCPFIVQCVGVELTKKNVQINLAIDWGHSITKPIKSPLNFNPDQSLWWKKHVESFSLLRCHMLWSKYQACKHQSPCLWVKSLLLWVKHPRGTTVYTLW